MSADSIFTIHRFVIPVKALNLPIYLIPFGDIHRFAHLCDVKKWQEFLDWAKRKKNAYFLGMGDYDDLISCSERQALTEVMFHDETRLTLEELFVSRTEKLCKEMGFMRNKLIGLLEGNHFGTFQSGMTTTQVMADKLNCKYLGISAFIRLLFIYGDRRFDIDIWAHHGKGASRLVGGSLNTVQQMSDCAEADIYLMGHDHKKSIAMKTKLMLHSSGSGISLSHSKVLMARTGSFLRGYVEDQPSYIARGAMSPTDMGVIKIELTPKRYTKEDKNLFYIDIHASL